MLRSPWHNSAVCSGETVGSSSGGLGIGDPSSGKSSSSSRGSWSEVLVCIFISMGPTEMLAGIGRSTKGADVVSVDSVTGAVEEGVGDGDTPTLTGARGRSFGVPKFTGPNTTKRDLQEA
ncbi:hypothetical protein FGB62_25g611 [Gracilaria domingensis]|nr:hypothetical protein FGB62_25g611 [Gracilaria domingensis]